MNKSGIQLVGAGDVTDDEFLNEIGDAALGTITAHQYSAYHNSPANTAYREAFLKLAGVRPNFFSVGGYDGMHLIKAAPESALTGASGGTLIEAMKGMAWEVRAARSLSIPTRGTLWRMSTSVRSKKSMANSGTGK